ncbi:MAG: Cof-type HAD-IIB family hydrolase [Gudongella sp.]|nr:Cof-type HAD-IIB family hydrolase [Gudongella sp.]
MDIKLIAIDMDGTLLNSENEITNNTRQILKEAKEKGVNIVLTTGRVMKSAFYYSKNLGLESYVVACNGGIIMDKQSNVLFKKPIPKDEIIKIMEIGKELSVYFHFYNEDTFFTNQYVKEVYEYYLSSQGKFTGQNIGVELYKNESEIIDRNDLNIYKFLFIDQDDKKLRELRNRLSEITDISLSSSLENNVEVMTKGVSKGIAIELLCDKLGITKENVMAIGDNENDLSMIDFAGIGVAMGNGSQRLKDSADFVAPSNEEDGVAYSIQKFIL